MARHTLLIDADDTLWENNIFFEKTIDDFITRLEHLGYTREYIRHILNETERRNIRQHGYGVRSFRRSLEDTYLKLAGNSARREIVKDIEQMARELENTPPHILDGVPETLAYLAKHHRLILLTKGEPAEQAAKVERSGLQPYFDAIEIVLEKDSGTYGRMIEQFNIVKSHGWMVGNSPRSDINPGAAVGSERRVHSAFGHVGTGKIRTRKRHRETADSFNVPRTPRTFLEIISLLRRRTLPPRARHPQTQVAGENIQLNGRIRRSLAFEALPRQPQSGWAQDICSFPKISLASVSESEGLLHFRCRFMLCPLGHRKTIR